MDLRFLIDLIMFLIYIFLKYMRGCTIANEPEEARDSLMNM